MYLCSKGKRVRLYGGAAAMRDGVIPVRWEGKCIVQELFVSLKQPVQPFKGTWCITLRLSSGCTKKGGADWQVPCRGSRSFTSASVDECSGTSCYQGCSRFSLTHWQFRLA